MALHAVRAADDKDRVVEHLQGALRFGGEIDVARRIEQRDVRAAAVEHRLLGKDGDAALAFECFGIQKGIAVIDAAERAQCARGIQKALGEGRFARVDMGEYPDGEFFHGLSSEKAPRRGASVFLYDTMLLRPRQMEKGCWRQPFRSQLL